MGETQAEAEAEASCTPNTQQLQSQSSFVPSPQGLQFPGILVWSPCPLGTVLAL